MEYLGDNKSINFVEPLVSVCVQTYQHAPFIRECLDSILMQETDFPFEIIIGEDESTDGTREICIEYAEKQPDKIRLFLRSRKDVLDINGNPTGRFNMIENLKAAKGKYVALLEGDDYWTDPFKLQKQVDFLERNEEIICSHHWHRYAVKKEEGYEEIEAPVLNQGYLKQRIGTVKEIFDNRLRLKSRTVMFRNIIDDDFFPTWFYKVSFGDVPLSMLLGKYGKFGFIDEPMAVYRQTNQGVSSVGKGTCLRTFHHFLNWITIWEYGIRFYDYDNFIEAKKTILEFYRHIISRYPLDNTVKLKLLSYSIFHSKLHFVKRIGITTVLTESFISQIILRLKVKVHKTLFQRA